VAVMPVCHGKVFIKLSPVIAVLALILSSK
jgi:hypothetical protein